jgi:hypothetical protein
MCEHPTFNFHLFSCIPTKSNLYFDSFFPPILSGKKRPHTNFTCSMYRISCPYSLT